MNCTCDLNVRNVGGIAFVNATNGLEREEKSLHASLDCFILTIQPCTARILCVNVQARAAYRLCDNHSP